MDILEMAKEVTSMEGLEICRICLSEESKINIFNNYTLFGILQKIMDEKIHPGDGLPDVICQLCEEKLKEISNFVTLSRKSSEKLKYILGNMGQTDINEPLPTEAITIKQENIVIKEEDIMDVCDEMSFDPEDLQNFDDNILTNCDLEIINPGEDGNYLENLGPLDTIMNSHQDKIIQKRRRKPKCQWSIEVMSLAVNEVINGAPLRETARKYDLPCTSLFDRVKAGDCYAARVGKRCIFTPDEENELELYINEMSKLFHGVTSVMVCSAAYEFAEKRKKNHHFNRNTRMAGKDWLCSFLKRHKDVVLKKSEVLSINRLPSCYQESLTKFYLEIESVMLRHKFKPSRIYNVDETGITVVQNSDDISMLRKQPATASWEKGKNITLCCCMNATGSFIPPMFVYPRCLSTSLMVGGGPPGSIHKFSRNGWMIKDLFYLWLRHFVAYSKASIEDPVLLVLDNHTSHISLNIHTFCIKNGIFMVSVPFYISDKVQPLNLTLFEPLKKAFHHQCHCASKITNQDIAPLFTNAYIQVSTAENAVDGFVKSGICPLNLGLFNIKSTRLELTKSPVHLFDEPGTSAEMLSVKNEPDLIEEPLSSITFTGFSAALVKRQYSRKKPVKTEEPDIVIKREGKFTFRCSLCDQIFKRKRELNNHKKNEHKVDYSCDICKKTFKSKKYLRGHSKIHTGERRHICEICGKGFVQKSGLNRHKHSHGERKYCCDYCQATFKQLSVLAQHVLIHTGEKRHCCDHCGKTFTQSGQLFNHYKFRHAKVPLAKKFKCNVCTKAFTMRGALNRHLETHDELKYSCEECCKKFKTKTSLQNHIKRIHLKIKQFTCDHCSKSFVTRHERIQHSAVHGKDNLFNLRSVMCAQCGAWFASPERLRKHKLIHSPNKKYACQLCSRKFHTGTNYRRHLKIHEKSNNGQGTRIRINS